MDVATFVDELKDILVAHFSVWMNLSLCCACPRCSCTSLQSYTLYSDEGLVCFKERIVLTQPPVILPPASFYASLFLEVSYPTLVDCLIFWLNMVEFIYYTYKAQFGLELEVEVVLPWHPLWTLRILWTEVFAQSWLYVGLQALCHRLNLLIICIHLFMEVVHETRQTHQWAFSEIYTGWLMSLTRHCKGGHLMLVLNVRGFPSHGLFLMCERSARRYWELLDLVLTSLRPNVSTDWENWLGTGGIACPESYISPSEILVIYYTLHHGTISEEISTQRIPKASDGSYLLSGITWRTFIKKKSMHTTRFILRRAAQPLPLLSFLLQLANAHFSWVQWWVTAGTRCASTAPCRLSRKGARSHCCELSHFYRCQPLACMVMVVC